MATYVAPVPQITTHRAEVYREDSRKPQVTFGDDVEVDLSRRDFTINAMALSLNPGSRGLLMDPFNGAADIEAKLIRVLHNYEFVEDPSRLIRATRFAARFHWPFEEKTQARFDSARENNYIEHITDKGIGHAVDVVEEGFRLAEGKVVSPRSMDDLRCVRGA